MLVARVVDQDVHHEANAPSMKLLDQLIEVAQRPEERIDVLVIADVIAVVVLRRAVGGRRRLAWSGVRLQLVETVDDASQIAGSVTVAVREASGVDLVDDGALPPVRGQDVVDAHRARIGLGRRWRPRLIRAWFG